MLYLTIDVHGATFSRVTKKWSFFHNMFFSVSTVFQSGAWILVTLPKKKKLYFQEVGTNFETKNGACGLFFFVLNFWREKEELLQFYKCLLLLFAINSEDDEDAVWIKLWQWNRRVNIWTTFLLNIFTTFMWTNMTQVLILIFKKKLWNWLWQKYVCLRVTKC